MNRSVINSNTSSDIVELYERPYQNNTAGYGLYIVAPPIIVIFFSLFFLIMIWGGVRYEGFLFFFGGVWLLLFYIDAILGAWAVSNSYLVTADFVRHNESSKLIWWKDVKKINFRVEEKETRDSTYKTLVTSITTVYMTVTNSGYWDDEFSFHVVGTSEAKEVCERIMQLATPKADFLASADNTIERVKLIPKEAFREAEVFDESELGEKLIWVTRAKGVFSQKNLAKNSALSSLGLAVGLSGIAWVSLSMVLVRVAAPSAQLAGYQNVADFLSFWIPIVIGFLAFVVSFVSIRSFFISLKKNCEDSGSNQRAFCVTDQYLYLPLSYFGKDENGNHPEKILRLQLSDITIVSVLQKGKIIYCKYKNESPLFIDLRGTGLRAKSVVKELQEYKYRKEYVHQGN